VLNKKPRYEDVCVGGADFYLHAFLTSILRGGERSASRPGRFISEVTALGTHGIGGWLGTAASLDAVAKRKFPVPVGNRTTVTQLVA